MAPRRQSSRGYRYGYGGSRSRAPEAAIRHIQEYEDLSRRLGPIVNDVQQAFFNLPPQFLEQLFGAYTRMYGEAPGQYARTTFGQWRNGTRRMSGQTAKRLLDLVPRFLTVSQRYDIVRKLCVYHTPKLNRSISLQVDDQSTSKNLSALQVSVAEFSQDQPLKAIPENVLTTVKWLNNEDVTAARALLAEVDAHIAANIRRVAMVELGRLEEIMRRGEITTSSHRIEFPNGTLSVHFSTPTFLGKVWRSLFG